MSFLFCLSAWVLVVGSSRGSVWLHSPLSYLPLLPLPAPPILDHKWFLKLLHAGAYTCQCFWLHDDFSSKAASCRSFCPHPSCPGPWWVLALGGLQWGHLKSHRVGRQWQSWGAASPWGPQSFLHWDSASVTLWCPPLGGSCSSHSLVTRCPLTRTLVWGFVLILLVCVCFLQGKKKKRKRDKQPGETNGK